MSEDAVRTATIRMDFDPSRANQYAEAGDCPAYHEICDDKGRWGVPTESSGETCWECNKCWTIKTLYEVTG